MQIGISSDSGKRAFVDVSIDDIRGLAVADNIQEENSCTYYVLCWCRLSIVDVCGIP